MNDRPTYAGRTASLATQHDKLPLIAPALDELVQLAVVETPVDTDRFGTFSGERARRGTALDTAVAKARAGMCASGLPIGLASEGTISPIGLVPVHLDTELVVIVDDLEGFVLVEHASSHAIVAHSFVIEPGDEFDERELSRAGFPEHGLIVRTEGLETPEMTKGIHDRAHLARAIADGFRRGAPRVVVESDLRAHHSPSRRPTIALAAQRLAERLARPCPSCRCPGWGVVDTERGLPCSDCRAATDLVRAEIWGCPRCEWRVTVPLSSVFADPSRCGRCNP